ncbi:MAG TPA: hypothetical protein VMY37_13845 [Thermoguttaceae bacterium]|nr:hypothetical protein [Thermoguttaceae bacterium]
MAASEVLLSLVVFACFYVIGMALGIILDHIVSQHSTRRWVARRGGQVHNSTRGRLGAMQAGWATKPEWLDDGAVGRTCQAKAVQDRRWREAAVAAAEHSANLAVFSRVR